MMVPCFFRINQVFLQVAYPALRTTYRQGLYICKIVRVYIFIFDYGYGFFGMLRRYLWRLYCRRCYRYCRSSRLLCYDDLLWRFCKTMPVGSTVMLMMCWLSIFCTGY